MQQNTPVSTLVGWQAWLYQQRVFAGNVIAFMGFVMIGLDPYAQITIPRLLVGGLVGTLGFLLRIWAVSYQYPNISVALPNAQTGLITAGPYAYVRHPIYLSMVLLVVGVFLTFGSVVAALAVVIPTLILNLWQIAVEDRFLLTQYGAEAQRYQRHLPALVPQVWNPYPTRQGQFSLEKGLKHDIGPLSAFVLFVPLMIIATLVTTPTLLLTLSLLVVAVLLSFGATWWVRWHYRHELNL